MKVLCIGRSTYDVASLMDDFLEENKNYDVTEKIESGGGQAANAACTLGKWGIETFLSTAIGSDDYGDKIKKEFEMNSVKLDFVESNFDKDTLLAFILVNKKNGSRTNINMTSQDRIAHTKKTELDIEPDLILIDGLEYATSSRTLNRFSKVPSIIDANIFNGEVVELAKECNYIIASKNFVENLTKMKLDFSDSASLLNVYNVVKSRYPRNEVIITVDDKGVIYSDNEQIKVMPSLKMEIKDRAAASDVFAGAFAYGILNNLGYEKTITYALIASGLTSANYGGRESMPALNSVLTYYNQKFGNVKDVQETL